MRGRPSALVAIFRPAEPAAQTPPWRVWLAARALTIPRRRASRDGCLCATLFREKLQRGPSTRNSSGSSKMWSPRVLTCAWTSASGTSRSVSRNLAPAVPVATLAQCLDAAAFRYGMHHYVWCDPGRANREGSPASDDKSSSAIASSCLSSGASSKSKFVRMVVTAEVCKPPDLPCRERKPRTHIVSSWHLGSVTQNSQSRQSSAIAVLPNTSNPCATSSASSRKSTAPTAVLCSCVARCNLRSKTQRSQALTEVRLHTRLARQKMVPTKNGQSKISKTSLKFGGRRCAGTMVVFTPPSSEKLRLPKWTSKSVCVLTP